jgi:hypothetical protein
MSVLSSTAGLVPRFLGIRKRVWIGIGLTLLVLMGLLVWALVASVSWLFGQAPGAAEAGKRAAGVAIEQVEKSVPGIREQVGVWIPGVAGVAGGAGGAAGAAKAEAGIADVTGSDIGPVARFAGLPRDSFMRQGESTIVRYVGKADYAAVLGHYAQGFAAAGYRQEVLAATRQSEHHRYVSGTQSIEFLLTGKADGQVEVELRQPG